MLYFRDNRNVSCEFMRNDILTQVGYLLRCTGTIYDEHKGIKESASIPFTP